MSDFRNSFRNDSLRLAFGATTDPASVARFCPYRSGFISSLVNVGFVANKVELGVDFLRILLFTPTVSFHRYP
jgi:hypothetical protein